jgi:hypothetical protein
MMTVLLPGTFREHAWYVNSAWMVCYFLSEVTPTQALEVLVDAGAVYMADIEKFVGLLRFSDRNCSVVTASEDLDKNDGLLSATSVALIKNICEIMLKQAGPTVREEYGGLRTSSFTFFVESLMVDGHIEDAWQLLVLHAMDSWFIGNPELHMLNASVAVSRAVLWAHSWAAAISEDQFVDENLIVYAKSSSPELQRWFLPTMEQVSISSQLFANVIRFLSSKRAWELSHAVSMVHMRANSRERDNVRLSVVKDVQTALERAIKKDKTAEYCLLHEYYCSYLSGKKLTRQAIRHLKRLLRSVRKHRQSCLEDDNRGMRSPLFGERRCNERQGASKESALWRQMFIWQLQSASNNSLQSLLLCQTVRDVDSLSANFESSSLWHGQRGFGLLLDYVQLYITVTPEINVETCALSFLLCGLGRLSQASLVSTILRWLDGCAPSYCYTEPMPTQRFMQPKAEKRPRKRSSAAVISSVNESHLLTSVNNRFTWRLWRSLSAILGSCLKIDESCTLDEHSDLHHFLFRKPVYRQLGKTATAATANKESKSPDVFTARPGSKSDAIDSMLFERGWWQQHAFAPHHLGNFVVNITENELDAILNDPIYQTVVNLLQNADENMVESPNNDDQRDLYDVCINAPSLRLPEKVFDKYILSEDHLDTLIESDDDDDDEQGDNSSDEEDFRRDFDADRNVVDSSRQKVDPSSDPVPTSYSYRGKNIDLHCIRRLFYFMGTSSHQIQSSAVGNGWVNEFLSGGWKIAEKELRIPTSVSSDSYKRTKLESEGDVATHPGNESLEGVFTSGPVVVKKRVFDLFERTHWERTSWGSHEKFTRLKIDIAQYLQYKLDHWELESLAYRMIVCTHLMSHSSKIGQDCLYVARGLQIIVMHALLELDGILRRKSSELNEDGKMPSVVGGMPSRQLLTAPNFCALRCIALLAKNNINLRRAMRVAFMASCRGVDPNVPVKHDLLLPKDRGTLRQSNNTFVYNPK